MHCLESSLVHIKLNMLSGWRYFSLNREIIVILNLIILLFHLIVVFLSSQPLPLMESPSERERLGRKCHLVIKAHITSNIPKNLHNRYILLENIPKTIDVFWFSLTWESHLLNANIFLFMRRSFASNSFSKRSLGIFFCAKCVLTIDHARTFPFPFITSSYQLYASHIYLCIYLLCIGRYCDMVPCKTLNTLRLVFFNISTNEQEYFSPFHAEERVKRKGHI